MAISGSKAFSAVSLTSHQAQKLETMMKQQVQDAILARSIQTTKDDKLDSEWRCVGSLGQLKTFKLRGPDPFSSTSSWATTLENTTRTTACNLNERAITGATTYAGRHSVMGRHEMHLVSRQTIGVCGRRDPMHHQPLDSFRCFGHVQGNYRDIVSVHHAVNSADFSQQQKLLSPSVIDGAVLRTIRATKDSYLGIKWLFENSFSGKRDICFVEMVGYTTDNKGQEVGFVAFASVDVPECPALSESKLKRVRMKRTMLVVPASEAASEIFVMGASEANESSIVAHAQHRLNMAVLNDISLVIDSQNLVKKTLLLRDNWVPDASRTSCTICSRKFHFMARRRHHCRMCGDVICKTCYVNRSVVCVDGNTESICQTKFCLRCVMGLRAIDKRLETFSPQVSKMLPQNINTDLSSTTETFEEFLALDSPDSNPRASSFFTLYKSTNALKSKGVGLAWNTNLPHKNSHANATIGGIGSFSSYGSSQQYLRTFSTSSLHSKSFGRLRRLSQLSRHSSVASVSSQPELFEEKMALGNDKINRILVI